MAVKRKLNPKQRRFVEEYLKDQNATQAYLRVYGGKPEVAQVSRSQLLRNPMVADLVQRGLARLADLANITAERNLRRMAEIAYHDKKVSKATALKACELIGKTFGQFIEVNKTMNVNVNSEVATEEQLDAAIKILNARFGK